MRSQLAFFACTLLALGACSVPSGGPQGGGQTGDPGVIDFESLDPTIPPGTNESGGGRCGGEPRVLSTAGGPADHGPQLTDLSAGVAVLFDPTRGLVLLDTTQAPPRVLGRLPLSNSLGQLHVSGTLAFLSRRNPIYYPNEYLGIHDDDELLAIDLSNPALPRILERLRLKGGPRLSMLVVSGGTTRVYVLSDAGSPHCGDHSGELSLDSYEWSDGHFVPRAHLSLGGRATRVQPLGDLLALDVEMPVSGSPTVPVRRFFSLAAPDGTLLETPQLGGTSGILYPHAPAELRLLTRAGAETGPGGVFRDLYDVDVYDVRDPRAPRRVTHCTASADLRGEVSHSARHIFHTTPTASVNYVTSVSVTDGTCEVRTFQGRTRRLRSVGSALSEQRVLDIDSDEQGALIVRLLDDADLRELAQLTVPGAGTLRGDSLQVLKLPGEQAALFSVAVDRPQAPPGEQSALALFRVTASGLAPRGLLFSSSRLQEGDFAHPVVWRDGGLAALDLSDPAQPKTGATADVMPRSSQVLAFDEHWARLRGARLELVPLSQDPDLAAAIASIEVRPDARRWVRVGSLLVSIAYTWTPPQTPLPWPASRPLPTTIEVFDLSDPTRPKRTAELTQELWLPGSCVDCASSLEAREIVGKDTLVLRTLAADEALSLQVLDLRDPARPHLSDPLPRPESEPILSAFGADGSVYYTYRVPVSSDAGGPDRARFYFRRVDLSDPAVPSIGERISTPGQLVAVDGTRVYTREAERDLQSWQLSMTIHRLALTGAGARVEASHACGARHALHVELSATGQVLLDLREPVQGPGLSGVYDSATRLRVLDGETLGLLGEGHVGPSAIRLATRQGLALYGVAQGVVLINFGDATAPEAQAYAPTSGIGIGSGLFGGGHFVVQDADVLRRLDLTTRNLPPAP